MHETHRCAVPGCPNLAAYDVRLYRFDVDEGVPVLRPDDDCPNICIEHARDRERAARPNGAEVTIYVPPRLIDFDTPPSARARGGGPR